MKILFIREKYMQIKCHFYNLSPNILGETKEIFKSGQLL